MAKKTVADLDQSSLMGCAVLVRSDLNVPLEGGRITEDQRIRASVPTLRHLTDAGARVIVLSHLGRPTHGGDPDFTLAPVATRLGELLDRPVFFTSSVSGDGAREAASKLRSGEVLLLENTRFADGDTANDPDLAADWASLATVFVNDAFGAAHRAHASTSGLADAVRAAGGQAVAGLLMAAELRYLGDAIEHPDRPFVAVLGGSKISGKIDVIESLLPKVDRLLIGGAMANTFFRAMGLEVGASLVEPDRVDLARALLDRAGERLLLPVDCVVAHEIAHGVPTRAVDRAAVSPGDRIGDIGPATRALYGKEIAGASTIIWNGPMGVFEIDEFAGGTTELAVAVAAACDRGATGVIGGGDSVAAAEQAGVSSRLTHISTGGGASLEFLAGRELPGVASLQDAA